MVDMFFMKSHIFSWKSAVAPCVSSEHIPWPFSVSLYEGKIHVTARSQLQAVQHITSNEPEEYFSNQFNH